MSRVNGNFKTRPFPERDEDDVQEAEMTNSDVQ